MRCEDHEAGRNPGSRQLFNRDYVGGQCRSNAAGKYFRSCDCRKTLPGTPRSHVKERPKNIPMFVEFFYQMMAHATNVKSFLLEGEKSLLFMSGKTGCS